jgi:peroxiredoxin
MKSRGGEVLALSMDEVEDSRRMVAELALPFRVLSALGLPTLADYGLVHADGGPEGETIALPAQLLVGRDGSVLWHRVAQRVTDRAAPEETLAAVAALPH